MGLAKNCQNTLKTQLIGLRVGYSRVKLMASTACLSFPFGNNISSQKQNRVGMERRQGTRCHEG